MNETILNGLLNLFAVLLRLYVSKNNRRAVQFISICPVISVSVPIKSILSYTVSCAACTMIRFFL